MFYNCKEMHTKSLNSDYWQWNNGSKRPKIPKLIHKMYVYEKSNNVIYLDDKQIDEPC